MIVNPVAGKDIRRLTSAASHTSDSAKIDIVRRTVIAAIESGAERVLVAPDPHHLGRRSIADLPGRIEILELPVGGSRADTVAAAEAMWKAEAGAIVALGGDGTCRDIAIGWPDAPLIAISTGTNNVYPSAIDATSAGSAAGFVANGAVDGSLVSQRSKRLSVCVTRGESVVDDIALVDVALIDTAFVGARAVLDSTSIVMVVAAIATPASTGLSSIAGRLHPVDRWQPGGVLVRLGSGGRRVRAPLSPGQFSTLEVIEIRPLADGETVPVDGRGVLAFDGERDRRIANDASVTVRVDLSGPLLIDVHATLLAAASKCLFDADPILATTEDPHVH